MAAAAACFPEGAVAAAGTLDTYAQDLEVFAHGCWIEEVREAMLPVGSMMLSFHSTQELVRLQGAVRDDIAEAPAWLICTAMHDPCWCTA